MKWEFNPNPRPYTAGALNVDNLTLYDLESVRKETGYSVQELFTALDGDGVQEMSSETLTAIVGVMWVMQRKIDPEFSLVDAQNQPLTLLQDLAPKNSPDPSG